jgi:hypothetical protein
MRPYVKHSHTSPELHLGSHTFVSLHRLRKAIGVRRSVHLFATIALALLASVGTLLVYYLSRGNSITPGSVGKIRYSGGTA